MDQKTLSTEKERKRPYIFSLLCVTLFVYSGMMVLIFLMALIYSNWISEVIMDYFSGQSLQTRILLYMGITGLLLHIALLGAAVMLWRMQRAGYYLMAGSFLLLILIPYFFGFGSWFSTVIYGVFILLFTIYLRKTK